MPADQNSLQRDVMNPRAFGLSTLASAGWPVIGALDRLMSDKRLNVSRPKVIFSASLIDATLIILTGLIADTLTGQADGMTTAGAIVRLFLVAAVATSLMRRNWAYTVRSLRNRVEQWRKLFTALTITFLVLPGAAFILQLPLFTPAGVAIWYYLAGLSMMLSRFALSKIIDYWTNSGRLVRRTVIVGGGPDAEAAIHALQASGSNHLQILGVFDDRDDDRSSDSLAGIPKLGNFEQLSAFCRNAGVDMLIVTVPAAAEERLLQIVRKLFALQLDIRISALSSKLRLNSRAYTYVGTVPMLAVMDRPLTDWDRAIKNIEDRVLGAVLLMGLSPIMALTALAVRLDSKGPVFFKQKRFGFNNELIEVYKFRSMYTDMSDATASKLVTKDDPRVTAVGRFIRKTSLDELPQLINVLKGEMSLVGPRPHATAAKAESDLYQSVVDGYYARHRMKPGVTGWAQVNGWRGETDTHEKIQRRVELDLAYIDKWSVGFDLYILALTPFALLNSKNAY